MEEDRVGMEGGGLLEEEVVERMEEAEEELALAFVERGSGGGV